MSHATHRTANLNRLTILRKWVAGLASGTRRGSSGVFVPGSAFTGRHNGQWKSAGNPSGDQVRTCLRIAADRDRAGDAGSQRVIAAAEDTNEG